MPGKWPDQTLDQAFGLPEVLVAVSTSRLSCKRAGRTRTLMPVGDSSGESRFNGPCNQKARGSQVGSTYRFAALVILSALLYGDSWKQGECPRQPAEITYGCERLPVTQEGGGLVHWVRVDLTTPGVELYVTPLD